MLNKQCLAMSEKDLEGRDRRGAGQKLAFTPSHLHIKTTCLYSCHLQRGSSLNCSEGGCGVSGTLLHPEIACLNHGIQFWPRVSHRSLLFFNISSFLAQCNPLVLVSSSERNLHLRWLSAKSHLLSLSGLKRTGSSKYKRLSDKIFSPNLPFNH